MSSILLSNVKESLKWVNIRNCCTSAVVLHCCTELTQEKPWTICLKPRRTTQNFLDIKSGTCYGVKLQPKWLNGPKWLRGKKKKKKCLENVQKYLSKKSDKGAKLIKELLAAASQHEVNIPASAEELISRFGNYFLSAGDLLTTLKIKRKVPAYWKLEKLKVHRTQLQRQNRKYSKLRIVFKLNSLMDVTDKKDIMQKRCQHFKT